jgi:hypothetical protein
MLAGSAFAANKGSLQLQHETGVAGKQLPAGEYMLRWDGAGDQVDLKIYQGKKMVLDTPVRVVKINRTSSNSAVVNTDADGKLTLSQIRFGGKDYALEIVSDSAGAGSGSGSR